jgi:hypothetical protein
VRKQDWGDQGSEAKPPGVMLHGDEDRLHVKPKTVEKSKWFTKVALRTGADGKRFENSQPRVAAQVDNAAVSRTAAARRHPRMGAVWHACPARFCFPAKTSAMQTESLSFELAR